MPNPFHYGAPAVGPQFVGRDREVAALVARVRAGVNVVVISPRRYGKTSLLLRAAEQLGSGRPRAAVISTNVFLCRDVATLAGRLVAGAYQLPGGRWARTRAGLAEFLRRVRVRPTVELGDDGRPRFSFTSEMAPADADAVLADVFALLASETGRPAALVLDEFQAITRHGAHLPQLLKGLSDEHPGVSLVLAGSQRHLMERLVVGDGAPLAGMAQHLGLGPIPDDEWRPFLARRAGEGGKEMTTDATAAVLDLAGPVPNDIQHLAFESFEVAGDRVDVGEVEEGMRRTVEHGSDLFAQRVARLSPGQLRVAVALALRGREHPFTGAFAREVGLASGQSVRKAIDVLVEEELVVLRSGVWDLADPFLATWLRQAG